MREICSGKKYAKPWMWVDKGCLKDFLRPISPTFSDLKLPKGLYRARPLAHGTSLSVQSDELDTESINLSKEAEKCALSLFCNHYHLSNPGHQKQEAGYLPSLLPFVLVFVHLIIFVIAFFTCLFP